MMKIFKYPDIILLTKAQPVEINDELRAWCAEAEEFCGKVSRSLGLLAGMAAPQMGRSIRAFVLHNFMNDPGVPKYTWYLNPEILWTPKTPPTQMTEGCYSLTDRKYDYKIWRHNAVDLKWQDLQGEWHQDRFKRTTAQVIQHEMDHLGGKCCNYQMNEAEERMDIFLWAYNFGYEIKDLPDHIDAMRDYTMPEAIAILNKSIASRSPDYDSRKINIDLQ